MQIHYAQDDERVNAMRPDYEAALNETGWLRGFGFFWDPISRAATLGQLDRAAQSKKAVAEVLALKPDFAARGRTLIHHYVKDPDMQGRLIEALEEMSFALLTERRRHSPPNADR